jgi:hypothetical protein
MSLIGNVKNKELTCQAYMFCLSRNRVRQNELLTIGMKEIVFTHTSYFFRSVNDTRHCKEVVYFLFG